MTHLFLIFQIATLVFNGIFIFYFYQQYKLKTSLINQFFVMYISFNGLFSITEFLKNYGIINLEFQSLLSLLDTIINALYFFIWTAALYTFTIFLFNSTEKRKNILIGFYFIAVAIAYFILHISGIIKYMINAGKFHICPPIGMVLTPVFLIIILLIYFLFITKTEKFIDTQKTYKQLLTMLLFGYILFLISSVYYSLKFIVPIISVFYLNIASYFWFKKKTKNEEPSIKIESNTELIPVIGENYSLSKREIEVLTMLLEGKKNKEIEDLLFISPNTTRNHIASIYKKIGINSRGQLTNLVLKMQKGD